MSHAINRDTRDRILGLLELDYNVSQEHELKVFPDPKVSGVYGVRAVTLNDDGSIDSEIADFIVNLVNGDIDEVEFETWPPTSGPLQFFL